MNIKQFSIYLLSGFIWIGVCQAQKPTKIKQKKNVAVDNSEWYTETYNEADENGFRWKTERFADIKIVRYQMSSFDKLTLNQKKLVYYLTQAGYAGRDIIWDQNYRYNLRIRRALENIVKTYEGDKSTEDWTKFMVYVKRVWFANGIHHHYSNDKFIPGYSKEYFQSLLKATNTSLADEIVEAMFNPATDAKKVSLDAKKDLLLSSATNFYDADISQKEAEAYYANKMDKTDKTPVSYGLNSKLVRGANGLEEKVWKIDGMYGESIKEIVKWLELAAGVAENKAQGDALRLLIEYYKTGDLKKFDEYSIAWAKATDGDIDYINSFIEVYNDPLGYRGSYETVVQMKDFDLTAKMAVLAENAQWFEDNSSISDEHKKKNVVGVSYKVVEVAGESGDSSPSTPIGVNLPNSNWIRSTHGSKSVSLGNIILAYDKAGGKGMLQEFCYTPEEAELAEKYGTIGDKMHTAMHEVIGHASGKINDGVGTPKETLKNYSSTLEEARADLVGLYYLYDQKLVDLGLIPSLEVGKEEYQGYIRNGLMTQLRRLKLGEEVEEAHMRNRQLVAAWVFEKGKPENVIEKVKKDGKTYFVINDFDKLRVLFGDLLKEIQRIKSEGDYEGGKNLVENYGVKVDQEIHKEVLDRTKDLNEAPYGGFINPKLVPVTGDNGEISDIQVIYPDDFQTQMMEYGEMYNFLPDEN